MLRNIDLYIQNKVQIKRSTSRDLRKWVTGPMDDCGYSESNKYMRLNFLKKKLLFKNSFRDAGSLLLELYLKPLAIQRNIIVGCSSLTNFTLWQVMKVIWRYENNHLSTLNLSLQWSKISHRTHRKVPTMFSLYQDEFEDVNTWHCVKIFHMETAQPYFIHFLY